MNRKICILILGLVAIIMTSCNKVDNNATMESTGVKPQISTQAPTGTKSKNSLVENSNEKKTENQAGISYKVVDGKYTDKEITIKYPQISDLGDDNIQKRINEILKAEALSVLGFYEDSNNVYLDITYKILWQSQWILSVQYAGVGNVKGAAYPLNLFYTVNINIDKGAKLTLRDFVKIDNNLVDSFRNFKVKDPETNQASASAFDYILNTYTAEDLIRYFEGADSSYQNSAFTFSYLTKDTIGISIEVPHAVGDHMEIELKYQDIKNNIKTENEIWNDLQLGEWLGNYEFYEYFPPNINMEYNISIYQDDDEYFANIHIDGFQTTQRIRADVIGNAEDIDLVFDTYLLGSTGERIEKGKILLSFKKEASEIYTYWGTIQPILPENVDTGKVYFTKVKE